MIRELILDYDNCLINSTATFLDIHKLMAGKNYINKEYPKWQDVHRYDFQDVLPDLTHQLKCAIFDSKLMFENPLWYDDVVDIVNDICQYTKVHIVSICSDESAIKKRKLIKEYMPNIHFQSVLFTEYDDKSHIDMRNAVYFDDVQAYLEKSSAWLKVCFKYQGIEMDINENWKGCTLNRWRKDIEGVQLKNLLGIGER